VHSIKAARFCFEMYSITDRFCREKYKFDWVSWRLWTEKYVKKRLTSVINVLFLQQFY